MTFEASEGRLIALVGETVTVRKLTVLDADVAALMFVQATANASIMATDIRNLQLNGK